MSFNIICCGDWFPFRKEINPLYLRRHGNLQSSQLYIISLLYSVILYSVIIALLIYLVILRSQNYLLQQALHYILKKL